MREMTCAVTSSRRTVLVKTDYTTEVRSCLKEPDQATEKPTNKEQEQNTSRRLSEKIWASIYMNLSG